MTYTRKYHTVRGFHPLGTTNEGAVFHEAQHSITTALRLNYGKELDPKFVAWARSLLRRGAGRKAIMEQELSGYAFKNFHEFLSEGMQEWIESPQPGAAAVRIGQEIERILRVHLRGEIMPI
jgi:hypothetical protein